MNRTFAMLLVAAAATGAAAQSQAQSGRRVFARGTWVEVRRITDDAGRIFTNPQLLAARSDSLFLYDAGTQELIALSPNGTVRWRVGRAGRGPREFSNPVDLQFAPNGSLHVLDSDVARISVVDVAGRVVDMATVEQRLHRIVPKLNGWWGVALARPELFVTLGSNGRATGNALAAPSDIASKHILVREPVVAPLPNGGAAIAFYWASRLLIVDSAGKLAADLDGPEFIPFAEVRNYTIDKPQTATVQRIDPKAVRGAWNISANDTMVVVLFGGRSGDAGRIVDRFDLRSRRYIDSARLTRPPAALRVVGNRLVALELDPAPAVVIYEWRRAAP